MRKTDIKVVVVGDTILDSYTIGRASRLSPEAPIPVVLKSEEKFNLGGAANVARNLSHLGVEVIYLSVIGKDEAGMKVKALLDLDRIGTDYLLERENFPTIHKKRIQVGQHQVVRIDEEIVSPLLDFEVNEICNRVLDFLDREEISCLVLSDYAKGVLTTSLLERLIKEARFRNVPILVDPKGNDFSRYQGVTLLTPNRFEASLATGVEIDSKESLLSAMLKLRSITNAKYTLVTLGEDGIALLGDDKLNVIEFPAVTTEVYDVSGAGDTVIAALAYSLSIKRDISEAIIFANVAASIVIKKLGASTTSLAEINAYSSAQSNVRQEVLYFPRDIEAVAKLGKEENLVFTNGCFDLLHLGHLKLLEEASNLGFKLIVGLNGDESVRKLKGPSRPINSEEFRSSMLSSLRFVHQVIIYNDETPLELVKVIKPHIIVKGGDYKVNEVIGREFSEKVIIIPFIPGLSTTEIISKINLSTKKK